LSYEALSQIVFQSETARLATVGAIEEKEHWDYLAEQLNLQEFELDNFWDEFWGGDQLDSELVAFTKTLKNDYRIGLLSNAWSGARDLLTRKYNFLDLFEISVFSAEVKMAKPDADFYQWMMEKLNVQFEESIFIDDFIENIHAANALGMQTVHFKDTDQAIGEITTILGK
jgi:putative hydrolase of the HAD superfamily